MNKKPNTFVQVVIIYHSLMEPTSPHPPADDRIIDAAVTIYTHNRENFNLASICENAGVNESEARNLFESKAETLRAFYRRAFNRFAELEGQVPDFSSYSLAEKLATLVFTYADEISNPDGFATETFRPLMLESEKSGEFKQLFIDRIAWYIGSDPSVSDVFKPLLGRWTYEICAEIVINLIDERLSDSSPGQERTSAWTDKWAVLIQSLLYAGTIDRLWDLGKYWYSQRNHNKDET